MRTSWIIEIKFFGEDDKLVKRELRGIWADDKADAEKQAEKTASSLFDDIRDADWYHINLY